MQENENMNFRCSVVESAVIPQKTRDHNDKVTTFLRVAPAYSAPSRV